MKKFFLALLFIPSLTMAAANDMVMVQRNATDTGQLTRIVAHPAGVTNGIMGYNGATQLPVYFAYGSGLTLLAGVLDATPQDWSVITGKPEIPAPQVQTDWAASAGLGVLLNKPTTVAGYGISDAVTNPELAAGLSTKFNTPTGTTSEYIRGDGTVTAFPVIPAAQVNSDWNAVSGAAQILNKPVLTSGTVTSVTAGSGLSGGVITASGTISLPNTGTAGTYSGITTDAQGRVTAGTNRSQSTASRTLNNIFQVSATRDSWVSYSVQITVTANIGGGQNGDVVLEIASNSGFTTDVQTLAITGVGQTYTLALALQGVQPQTGVVSGFVPAGYYARLRTVNNTGAPAFSYRAGQEALF